MIRIVTALAALVLLGGCSDWTYQRTATGKLKGTLMVKWLSQDQFVFLPDAQDPLTFTRAGNEVITPKEMFTDGGTIPPALRAIKAYSPWGYAPAFIIHDWLFAMKHCKVPGFEKYDLDKAATILAEVMKTVMENPKYGGPNKLVHYSMYEGVRSSAAKEHWDNGTCDTPSGPKSMAGPEAARERARPMMRASPSDVARPRFVIQF